MDNEKITHLSEYEIRYSRVEELNILEGLLKNPEAKKWFPIESDEEAHMMARNWIGFSRYLASLTGFYKDEPIAFATLFLMPYRKVAHHALIYFVVDPKFQGKGVGTSMIRNITHLGKNNFRLEFIHVELYAGCKAIPILSKCGYMEIVRQEKFVKLDDRLTPRILMEIDLRQK